jgi:hypothetical protein
MNAIATTGPSCSTTFKAARIKPESHFMSNARHEDVVEKEGSVFELKFLARALSDAESAFSERSLHLPTMKVGL